MDGTAAFGRSDQVVTGKRRTISKTPSSLTGVWSLARGVRDLVVIVIVFFTTKIQQWEGRSKRASGGTNG